MGKSETLLPSIHLILIHVTCKLVKIAHPSPHKLSISPPKTASIIHTPHEFPTLWGRKKIGKIYPSFRGYLLQALQHSSVAASQHQRKQALWPPTKRALTCSDTPSRQVYIRWVYSTPSNAQYSQKLVAPTPQTQQLLKVGEILSRRGSKVLGHSWVQRRKHQPRTFSRQVKEPIGCRQVAWW